MPPRDLLILLIAIALLLAAALGVVVLIRRAPRRRISTVILWYLDRIFCRIVHRPTYVNRAIVPKDDAAVAAGGGLIVVSNHTGAVDPLLIQGGCRFWIRWMMASDMMSAKFDWLWKGQDMIPVARDRADMRSLRTAIRHVQQGGAIGIFPEGRIVNPPREVRPFFTGVGMMIAKTKAPVLLVWVSGTPDTNKLRESILTRSNARVEFVDLIEFGAERDAERITETLRRRIHEVSGWPINDEMLPMGGVNNEAPAENVAV